MIQMLKTYMDAHWYREDGATAVEYGIMVALIAVVIIAVVATLGTNLQEVFRFTGEKVGAVDTTG